MPTYSDAFLQWGPVIQLWSVFNEREANRAALIQKDTEMAALRKRIAELETPPPEPPPPPAPTPTDRVQVIWPAGLMQGPVESIVNRHDLQRVYACVLAADVAHRAWGPPLLARLRGAGVKVYAYVRAPVHARVGVLRDAGVGPGIGAPFENAVYHLVVKEQAWTRDPAGNILWHPSGYDGYITPWLVAGEHARLVRRHVWDTGEWDGILADGLVTNQIYAGGGADFDGDRVADVVQEGWSAVSLRQRAALRDWMGLLSDVPLVGNGLWEPLTVTPLAHAEWWTLAAGAMDEDITHPHYPNGDETRQGPELAQRWEMHRQCAVAWLAAGKDYFIGSRARLHRLEREQERRFTLATALLVGARWVDNDPHEWLARPLGKRLSETAANGVWSAEFEHGLVVCDSVNRTGRVTFR